MERVVAAAACWKHSDRPSMSAPCPDLQCHACPASVVLTLCGAHLPDYGRCGGNSSQRTLRHLAAAPPFVSLLGYASRPRRCRPIISKAWPPALQTAALTGCVTCDINLDGANKVTEPQFEKDGNFCRGPQPVHHAGLAGLAAACRPDPRLTAIALQTGRAIAPAFGALSSSFPAGLPLAI